MKIKFLIPLSLAILLGFFASKVIYGQYTTNNSKSNYNSYFLQQGVYTTLNSLKSSTKSLEYYITQKINDKYYVYVGITSNIDNANKLKEIYKEKKIPIYVRKVNVDNLEFYSNLEQYDILLSSVSKPEDMLSITKVILSSYEETVLTN